MLDSVQGRGLSTCISFVGFKIRIMYLDMGFYRTIHSRSYTYIIKNLYEMY